MPVLFRIRLLVSFWIPLCQAKKLIALLVLLDLPKETKVNVTRIIAQVINFTML